MIALHDDDDQDDYRPDITERAREAGDFGPFENMVMGVLLALAVLALVLWTGVL